MFVYVSGIFTITMQFYRTTFEYMGAQLFNSLPEEIRAVKSYTNFKRALQTIINFYNFYCISLYLHYLCSYYSVLCPMAITLFVFLLHTCII